MPPAVPVVLTIAGSDSGGGAGIQADLKACEANGAFGTTAIAALTAQNTCGVQGVFPVDAQFLEQQINSVLDDIGCTVAKTGMLPTTEIITTVAKCLKGHKIGHLVIDPVMVASSGDPLIADDAVASFISELFPLASIITPNLPEASKLLGRSVSTVDEMEAAAVELLQMGPRAVLLKGGHLEGSDEITDVFATRGEGGDTLLSRLPTERVLTSNVHGTGCTLASAIAATLAKQLVGATELGATTAGQVSPHEIRRARPLPP
jgi:hydroxymethylpyrimidine/phosphomethylpyrimidine kinase